MITDEGFQVFAMNGDKFQGLNSLNFDKNQIKSDGLKALAENGNKFRHVNKIGLSKN
jgi:hypothetical protein